MKTNRLIIPLSIVAIAACVAGCDSKTKPDEKVGETKNATTETTAKLKDAASQAVENVKDTAAAVGEKAKETATAAATEVKQVAGEMVDKTKAAAANATTEAQKAVESVKTSAAGALSGLVKPADPAATVAATTQAVIDKAKALVDEKKYQEALTSLNELVTASLSPGQQKAVDELKATIQAALGK